MGGWLGSLVEQGQDSRLGAWYTIYAIGGAGIGVLISGWATQTLPPAQAAALIFIAFLVPLFICLMIPAPPPSRMLASENFSRLPVRSSSCSSAAKCSWLWQCSRCRPLPFP